jgi:hypothetical protein
VTCWPDIEVILDAYFKNKTLESYFADMDKFVQSVVDCSKTGYMAIKIRKVVANSEQAANGN